jgi:hypothetical protein
VGLLISRNAGGGYHLQRMSGEETRIYGAIIDEQIFLQEIQAKVVPHDDPDDREKESAMVSGQITEQRVVLSTLWEMARAIRDNSQKA